MQLAWSYAPPLIIEAALRNQVFDLLDTGPKTIEEVTAGAGASGARHPGHHERAGWSRVAHEGCGRTVRPQRRQRGLPGPGKPGYFGGMVKHTSTQLVPAWLQLSEIVRTGKSALGVNRQNSGSEFFHEFVEDIFPMSYGAASRLADVLEVAAATSPVSVLDLAAGSGCGASPWPRDRRRCA